MPAHNHHPCRPRRVSEGPKVEYKWHVEWISCIEVIHTYKGEPVCHALTLQLFGGLFITRLQQQHGSYLVHLYNVHVMYSSTNCTWSVDHTCTTTVCASDKQSFAQRSDKLSQVVCAVRQAFMILQEWPFYRHFRDLQKQHVWRTFPGTCTSHSTGCNPTARTKSRQCRTGQR